MQNPKLKSKRRARIRIYGRHKPQSFQDRLLYTFSSYMSSVTSDAKSLKEVRSRLKKIVENEDFWKQLDSLCKTSNQVAKLLRGL